MNSRIFTLILAVGVGVGIGIGASTVVRMAFDDPSIDGLSQRAAEGLAQQLAWGESSELDPEQVAQIMESLIQTLDEEISERHFLAAQLEEVRSEMTEMLQDLRARFGTAFPGNASNTASPQPGAQVDQTIEERLAVSGFTPQQIRAISRRVAETQMQQIELDDRARREGWITTSRYFEEFNNLVKGADTVRRDLGDDAYSHFLFAIGRPVAAFPGNASNTASPQPGAQVDQTIEERLAVSGFTPQQIRAISRRVAETQMQQIELDDRARREGWITTSRYFEEFNNLVKGADTVRRDLGDDAYSHFLFAIGRPNRLTVGRVIETSPAEQAGLHLGDVIRSYAGERVFSSAQLTNLRSSGDKDMPIIVEIIRDGEPMQIWIPRGPMGIQIQQDRVDPSAPGGG